LVHATFTKDIIYVLNSERRTGNSAVPVGNSSPRTVNSVEVSYCTRAVAYLLGCRQGHAVRWV